MAHRIVTEVIRDGRNRIAGLVNRGEPWSPVSTAEAFSDLVEGRHEYTSISAGNPPAKIIPVDGVLTPHVRTVPDNSLANNLLHLKNRNPIK